MAIKSMVVIFVMLWLASLLITLASGNVSAAAKLGDSFGVVNSLFSGLALVLAIYSMIFQQKQSAEFEQKTLEAMARHTETIELIRISLEQQRHSARATALALMIQHEEQKIETFKEWGRAKNNENQYSGGIKAAQNKIKEHQDRIGAIANA